MKKQYMNYMKSCLLVMIACLVCMGGAAQGFSPAAMEQLKTRRLWSHSQNAAGMPFDDIQNYSNVILGYDLQDGNYCRPQEGQKEAIVGVSSEGFINLKNAYVWGAFNFAQKNLTIYIVRFSFSVFSSGFSSIRWIRTNIVDAIIAHTTVITPIRMLSFNIQL